MTFTKVNTTKKIDILSAKNKIKLKSNKDLVMNIYTRLKKNKKNKKNKNQ